MKEIKNFLPLNVRNFKGIPEHYQKLKVSEDSGGDLR